VKSTHIIKLFETRKKDKIWKYKNFLRKSSSKRSFRHRIHSELMSEDSLTSFTDLTHIASLRIRHSFEVKNEYCYSAWFIL